MDAGSAITVKLHEDAVLIDPRDIHHVLPGKVVQPPVVKKTRIDVDHPMSPDDPMTGATPVVEAVLEEGPEIGEPGEATPTPTRKTKRGGKLNIAPEDRQKDFFGATNPEDIPVVEYDPYFQREFGYTRYNYDKYLSKAKSHGSGWALRYTNLKRPPTLTKYCLGVVVCKKCTFIARPETVATLPPNTLRCPECPEGTFLEQTSCRGKEGKPVTQTFLTRDQETVYLRNDGVHGHEAPPVDYPCVGTQKGTEGKEKKIHRGTTRFVKKGQKSPEREAAACSPEQGSRSRRDSECSMMSVHHSELPDRKLEGGAPEVQSLPASHFDCIISLKTQKRKLYENDDINLATGDVDGPQLSSDKDVTCPEKSVQEGHWDPVWLSLKKSRQDVPSPCEQASSNVVQAPSSPSQPMQRETPATSHALIPTPVDKMECTGDSSEDARNRDSGAEQRTLASNVYPVTDENDGRFFCQSLSQPTCQQPKEKTPVMSQSPVYHNPVNQSLSFEYSQPGRSNASSISVPAENGGTQDASRMQDDEQMDTDCDDVLPEAELSPDDNWVAARNDLTPAEINTEFEFAFGR